MKTNLREHRASIEGAVTTKEFGVNWSSKMVDILSNGIYKHKIEALLRELSTNAYDAHVENNCADKPFDIHLPVIGASHFYIRDYGLGMSEQKVYDLYTKYGASDKDTTNEAVGCFGLGSKTPFCYNTRTAVVESWHNGIHYIYNIYIATNGMPEVALIGSEESNEPSGVKITVPVTINDIGDFERTAKKVYQYFNTKPNFVNKVVDIPCIDYVYTGSNWKLRNDGNHCRLIMGGVAYPVSFTSDRLQQQHHSVMRSDMDIFVDIGYVEVDVSREGLSYTPYTKEQLILVFNTIVKELENMVEEDISNSKNLWGASCKAEEFKDNLPYDIGTIIKYNGIRFNNQEVNKYIDLGKDDLVIKYEYRGSNRRPLIKNKCDIITANAKKPQLIINDIKVGAKSRCEYTSRQALCDVYLIEKDNVETIRDIIGADDDDFTLASALPYVSAAKRSNNKRKTTSVMEYNPNSKLATLAWQPVSIDLENDAPEVYVVFDKWHPNTGKTTINHSRMSSLMSSLIELKLTVPNLIGIKKHNIDEFKNAGWSSLYDYVQNQLLSLNLGISKKEILEYKKAINTINIHMASNFRQLLPFINDKQHCIYRYVDEVDRIKKIINQYQNDIILLDKINYFLGIDITSNDNFTYDRNLHSEYIAIQTAYPLLCHMGSGYSDEIKEFAKYITLIDGENKNVQVYV